MGSSSDSLPPDGSTLTFGYDCETEEIRPLQTLRSARSSPGRIFRTDVYRQTVHKPSSTRSVGGLRARLRTTIHPKVSYLLSLTFPLLIHLKLPRSVEPGVPFAPSFNPCQSRSPTNSSQCRRFETSLDPQARGRCRLHMFLWLNLPSQLSSTSPATTNWY